MIRRAPALLVAAALALAACGDDEPPPTRPPDLAVRYSWNLAPADVVGELAIADGKARYREKIGANEIHFSFTPAKDQLDALWQTLRGSRIDTLETVERKPGLRRAVESLVVRWGTRTITLHDGIKVRLRPEDRERWRRIQLALRAVIMVARRKRGLHDN